MSALGILLISFTPGLFWLWFFVRLDRIRPSSHRWIVLSFIFGMASTIPAALVSTVFLPEDVLEPGAALASVSMAMLLVVGPVEEGCKFLAVRLAVYRSLYFEEPMHGLVYGAAASLGFASVENLFYVLTYGPEVMLLRAPFSTLAHLVFGSLWGYGLGLRRTGRGPWVIWVGLVGAAALHATSNILLLSDVPWIALVLDAFGAIAAFLLFKWGQRTSPFRYRRNVPLMACRECGRFVRIISTFCQFCGARQALRNALFILCGNCESMNRPNAAYCTQCGDMLLRKLPDPS